MPSIATHAKNRHLRYGAVTISQAVPDDETLVFNLNAGREALGRAKEALIKPGVILRHRADVPTFRVDAHNPEVMIREIGGRIERGRIVNGAFRAAD